MDNCFHQATLFIMDGNSFGLEHGKIGDRIAVVLNRKKLYKGLYRPTNPHTPKQQMQHAKLQ